MATSLGRHEHGIFAGHDDIPGSSVFTAELVVDGMPYTISMVDTTNMTVFLRTDELRRDNTEPPTVIEEDKALFDRFERSRARARR